MSDSLARLLALPASEKIDRGILYTPQEIAQQPETWLTTYEILTHHQAKLSHFLKPILENPQASVFLVGAGSSDYVGQVIEYSLRQRWLREVVPVASTDLLTHLESFLFPTRPSLWISFSRSGDSPEAIALLRAALENLPQVLHVIISCNKNGQLLQEFAGHPRVYSIVLDDAVNDRGLAMTSSFTNMVVAGECLANLGNLAPYERSLQLARLAAKRMMSGAADLAAEVAAKDYPKVCFLGSGPLKAIARESALKVLELSAGRMTTLWESSLGLRHGPLCFVDDQTILVSYLSGQRKIQSYETDLLREVQEKKLGALRIAILAARSAAALSDGDDCLSLDLPEKFPDEHRAVIDVIFGQLLGLFLSLRHGLRPDNPSPTGVISRVVAGVRVYDPEFSGSRR